MSSETIIKILGRDGFDVSAAHRPVCGANTSAIVRKYVFIVRLCVGAGFNLLLAAMLVLARQPASAYAGGPSRAKTPNIILILTDDLGWADLGCYGSKIHETPHLDRLAARGMKFTNAYAACSVCSPTRASLLTGKYPARLHLTHIIEAAHAKHGQWQDPDWTPYLPLAEVTIAESLQAAGYATGLIGKWHVGGHAGRSAAGDRAEGDPLRQGFMENVAGSNVGQPPDYFFPYTRTVPNGQTYQIARLPGGAEGEYLTDRLTDEAEKFIERRREQPFFLFLSHFAPHTSMGDRLQAPEHLIARFAETVNPDDPQHDPVYAAMLASLDDSVGRILKKLDDLGLAENTLVIFTSDNGGYGSKTSNLPLRGAKHSPYEGGLRVPALVCWPGKVMPGSTSNVPIITPDFFPTMLEAAGVRAEPGQTIDGLSLMPVLTGAGKLERTSIYWHYPHCDTEPYSVVREGDFKLIEFLADGRCELYNLREDAEEKSNLAGGSPEIVAHLRQNLAQWRQSVGAQMPVPVK